MPLKQLPVVKKIKYLVSNIILSKKQIVDIVQKDAKEHRSVNLLQERDDNDRVNHAIQELHQENNMRNRVCIGNYLALAISVAINFILLFILLNN